MALRCRFDLGQCSVNPQAWHFHGAGQVFGQTADRADFGAPGQLDREERDGGPSVDVLNFAINAKLAEGFQQLLGLVRDGQTAIGFVDGLAFFQKIQFGELPFAVVLHLWRQRGIFIPFAQPFADFFQGCRFGRGERLIFIFILFFLFPILFFVLFLPIFFVCVRQFVLVFILFLIFFPLFFFGVSGSSTATVPRAWFLRLASTGSSAARRRRLGLHQLITTVMDSGSTAPIWQRAIGPRWREHAVGGTPQTDGQPVPQMIGVPSQPKRGLSSPTIHAPTRRRSRPADTPNPLANAAHSAARAKVLMTTPPARTQSGRFRAPEWIGSAA